MRFALPSRIRLRKKDKDRFKEFGTLQRYKVEDLNIKMKLSNLTMGYLECFINHNNFLNTNRKIKRNITIFTHCKIE